MLILGLIGAFFFSLAGSGLSSSFFGSDQGDIAKSRHDALLLVVTAPILRAWFLWFLLLQMR